MLALTGPEELENLAFKWDKKRGVGGKNKKVQFYESFSYDGMDYALYDCVYMHKEGAPAPYIGKLVKIWETAEGIKKVKVHWFFRPSEISYYLKDAKVSENELFFASGDGKGLANLNPLEAIAGKCNVVCTSTDNRNQQPSAKELQMADYVFYRIFDVNSCTISDQIDDKVGGLEVNFVFNRRDGIGTLDGPKLDAGEKYEGIMVAFKETPEIAGNNSPQQLRNTKLDKNGNHALDDNTHAMQMLVKQGNLDGKHFSGVDVISSKNSQIAGTVLEERNTTGDKNLGSKICEKEDKFKDIKLPVSQVHVEKGVKHAGKSRDLDNAPSKRVKIDGSIISKSNGVEGAKDSVGCRKDAKKAENSSPLDEKGVSLSKEAAISGHAEDAVGLQKNSEPNENPNALQEKLSKPNAFSSSEKEKSRSTLRKDSFVAHKDTKVGGKKDSGGEKTSRTNVVSQDVTPRPSTTNVSPKETPKSVPNKDVDESERVAKPAQSLSTKKRPLEMTVVESKEESNLGHDKSHENKEKKIGGNSCPKDEAYLKKAKLDNSIKRSEGNKDNNIKKVKETTYVGPKNSPKVATCDNNGKTGVGERLSKDHNEKEKNHAGEMKNSPKSLTCDDKSKLKLREGSPKEFDNEKDGKKILPKSLTCGDKTKSKLREGPSKEYDNGNDGKKNSPKSLPCDNKKNSPKSLTCDDKAKAKLREGPSKEHDNEKDGKLSNNNLPNRNATKSKDGDGRKVGGKIIEVTRRPPEKATWIKLSWEQQMKTAQDQGRLVLLLNLDPQYTSGEVEDIIWHTFSESCTARVLPHTAISDPNSGHAFVVFKSRDAANKVVDKLDEGCLMLPNQRPLVACYGDLPKLFANQTTYVGHLQIDKVRRQMLRGTKEAVSTSHYSQSNTIEFEMAMDWCLLQSKSDKWWKTLHELHRKELKKHADNFKSK